MKTQTTFVQKLKDFKEMIGDTSNIVNPVINGIEIDFEHFFLVVSSFDGYEAVSNKNIWNSVSKELNLNITEPEDLYFLQSK